MPNKKQLALTIVTLPNVCSTSIVSAFHALCHAMAEWGLVVMLPFYSLGDVKSIELELFIIEIDNNFNRTCHCRQH
jgi:ABC-type molybdate transport system permease subunit